MTPSPGPSADAILAGYDALSDMYAHVPPLIIWRAWEYAVYRRHVLEGPVLDVGCGDGRFFDRVFPSITDVVGIDHSDGTVDAARRSGRYREVLHAPAQAIPAPAGAFASVFANCALEHMDNVDGVLAEIHRVTRPGGTFLFSVVTDAFVTMQPLAGLLAGIGAAESGRRAQQRHEDYHHLVNGFPIEEWQRRTAAAGFAIREVTPIVDGAAGWIFLLFDQLWHMPTPDGELGDGIAAVLEATPSRGAELRGALASLLRLGVSAPAAGVVIHAVK